MADLGLDTVGAFSFTPFAGEKRVYKHTLPAGTWEFTGLRIYDLTSASWKSWDSPSPVAATAGGNVPYYPGFIYGGSGLTRLLLYADSAGVPGARVMQSDELTITTPVFRYNDPVTGTNQFIDADVYSDGATDPYGTADVTTQHILSVYAVYQAVAVTSFTLSVPPTVTGALIVGGTLTANPGTWTPTPTSYTYYWQRADDAAATNLVAVGTSGSTYTLSSSDLNKYLRAGVLPQ